MYRVQNLSPRAASLSYHNRPQSLCSRVGYLVSIKRARERGVHVDKKQDLVYVLTQPLLPACAPEETEEVVKWTMLHHNTG